jgi:peptidoglycan-associated lipoprotein
MNILLKFAFICFLIVNLISCTSQNEKVLVEGAGSEVSSSMEEGDKAINEDNKNISIEDDLSETTKINKILNEKLVEVGDRVFFDYDQSSFKKEGIETLKRQASFLIANQNITVTIEGHCDARGTREYNLALGERRAYSVKSFLTSLGVEDSRISIISFGKEKLQSLENNEKAWAQSRTAITTINP